MLDGLTFINPCSSYSIKYLLPWEPYSGYTIQKTNEKNYKPCYNQAEMQQICIHATCPCLVWLRQVMLGAGVPSIYQYCLVLTPQPVRQSYDVISSSHLQNTSNCIYLGGFLDLFQSLITGGNWVCDFPFILVSVRKDIEQKAQDQNHVPAWA